MSPRTPSMEGALEFARAHAARNVSYVFSMHERMALNLFFSNTTKYVFLIENLPSNVRASLLAMYSRMQNDRGLRGVFVDKLVPSFLATQLTMSDEDKESSIDAFLKKHGIERLDDFVAYSEEAEGLFRSFCKYVTGNREYIRSFANSERIRKFLSTWLDAYGHNSIARNGEVAACFEEISTLAAKAVEHVRPGAGFIELSTRYVDMTKASWYPIGDELAEAGYLSDRIEVNTVLRACADAYLHQMTAYKEFLGRTYADAAPQAIFGEVCDVLANALPAGTTTSVGCVVSGEAVRSLLKCLRLEGLSETTALAEVLEDELAQTGLGQFARHADPSPFEERLTGYLDVNPFWHKKESGGDVQSLVSWSPADVEHAVRDACRLRGYKYQDIQLILDQVMQGERREHDKLPAMFEEGQVRFAYTTTFRTWREIQRHVIARNERTLLTPHLGFFRHSKPISGELEDDFARIADRTASLYRQINAQHPQVPGMLERLQYVLPLGFHVGATFSSNLRNMDFFTWQRSGFNVNHEARQVALSFDACLCRKLPWWPRISRTDRTPAYRLAREKVGVPLTQEAAEAA